MQFEAGRVAKQQKLWEERPSAVLGPPSNGAECQSSGPEDDFESCLINIKSQYEVFLCSRLSPQTTVLTPNTETILIE